MTTPTDLRMVEVCWVDSNSCDAWQSVEDTLATMRQSMACRSIGYLLADDPDRVILVGNLNDTGQVCASFAIPRVAITSLVNLSAEAAP